MKITLCRVTRYSYFLSQTPSCESWQRDMMVILQFNNVEEDTILMVWQTQNPFIFLFKTRIAGPRQIRIDQCCRRLFYQSKSI
jgi:hypothetical protein